MNLVRSGGVAFSTNSKTCMASDHSKFLYLTVKYGKMNGTIYLFLMINGPILIFV